MNQLDGKLDEPDADAAEHVTAAANAESEARDPPVDAFQRARTWLNGLVCGPGFRMAEGGETSLAATACAVLLLEGIGDLPPDPSGCRIFLQDCQDPQSGLFQDPAAVASAKEEDADGHLARFHSVLAVHALDALDARPRHPLDSAEQWSDQSVDSWLDGMAQVDPLLENGRIAGALNLLIFRAEVEGCGEAVSSFHRMLDWLDRHQNASSGLWPTSAGMECSNAVVASAQLVQFFEYVERPITRSSRMLEAILGHEQTHGAWAGWHDGPWRDFLRTDAMTTLSDRTGDRQYGDIERTLTSSYWTILGLQEPDGSFPIGDSRAPYHRNAGDACLPPDEALGALGTTWLRLLTLATIVHHCPAALPQHSWRFRRRPGLGFQRDGSALTDHQRQMLPMWIKNRSLPIAPRAESATAPPAVSVIVPCYNLGRFLHEAIESVLRQSGLVPEIIVVDDGSSDEVTRLVLDALEARGLRVLRQLNRGVAAARNYAIGQANGRYICCLDADDRLRPDYLARAASIMDEQPEVGLVTGYIELFDEEEGTVRNGASGLCEMLVFNQAIEPALFRREAWKVVGGYWESFPTHGIEDWDLWISMMEAGYRIVQIPEAVWEYRVRPGQMSDCMYRPENWERLMHELARRHQDSYVQHTTQIAAKQGARWAELKQWLSDRNRSARWWQRQAENWQRVASEQERIIREQKALIEELQRGQARSDDQHGSREQAENWPGDGDPVNGNSLPEDLQRSAEDRATT